MADASIRVARSMIEAERTTAAAMPTCTNQQGYNLADAQGQTMLMMYQQQAQANVQLAQGGHPVAGANGAGYTVQMASEVVWYCFYYYLARIPSTLELTPWAGAIYNQQMTATQVVQFFGTCPECYARFGCS